MKTNDDRDRVDECPECGEVQQTFERNKNNNYIMECPNEHNWMVET